VSSRTSSVLVALVLAALLAGLPAHASAEPVAPPLISDDATVGELNDQLDAATKRALELEREIESITSDLTALEARVAVTAERIRAQRTAVEAAQAELAVARALYEERLVATYKTGPVSPIALLLSADTVAELFARASLLSRIAEEDSRVVADLNLALAEARYQASVLDDLRAQDIELRRLQTERLEASTKALAEQEALVERLTEEARAALLAARKLDAETRQRWRDSSISGDAIERAEATVLPYTDRVYLCSAYMPRTYQTTNTSLTAVCSWYGNEFHGRTTASGQIFNENDFTCASRTLPFGTILALTRGERRIIVVVNDRGPFIAGRDLDLSKAAARALGFSGVEPVHAEIVLPSGS